MLINELYECLTASSKVIPPKLEESDIYNYLDFEEKQYARTKYERVNFVALEGRGFIFALGSGSFMEGRGGNYYKFKDVVCLEMVGSSPEIEAKDRLQSNWRLNKSLFWDECGKIFTAKKFAGLDYFPAKVNCFFVSEASEIFEIKSSAEEAAAAVKGYLLGKASLKESLIAKLEKKDDLGSKLSSLALELDMPLASLPNSQTHFFFNRDYFLDALSISNS